MAETTPAQRTAFLSWMHSVNQNPKEDAFYTPILDALENQWCFSANDLAGSVIGTSACSIASHRLVRSIYLNNFKYCKGL